VIRKIEKAYFNISLFYN